MKSTNDISALDAHLARTAATHAALATHLAAQLIADRAEALAASRRDTEAARTHALVRNAVGTRSRDYTAPHRTAPQYVSPLAVLADY